MKNRKMIIAGMIAATVLATSVSTYAMNDAELQKYIISQVQLEENISPDELQEITMDLEGMGQKDIIKELYDEINELDDEVLKKKLLEKAKSLTETDSVENFFLKTEKIYEILDEVYEGDDEEDYISFDEDKKEILEGLNEELSFASEAEMKKQITSSINTLTGIEDEDLFYDSLDAEYEKIDVLYGDGYFNEDGEDIFEDGDYYFDEMKQDLITEVKEEIKLITDTQIKEVLEVYLQELEKIKDEDNFFNKFDEIYENKELEEYYTENDIEIGEGEDFEDFNLEDEKEEILTDLKTEVQELTNNEFKKQVLTKIETLELETTQDKFFDTLDSIYDELDKYYESEEDSSDQES